jgi:hypothetical protein
MIEALLDGSAIVIRHNRNGSQHGNPSKASDVLRKWMAPDEFAFTLSAKLAASTDRHI